MARKRGERGSRSRIRTALTIARPQNCERNPPNLLAHYPYLWEPTVVRQAIDTALISASSGGHSSRYWCQHGHSKDHRPHRHLTACFTCPLKPNCTPDKLKRIKRWKHEGVLDAIQARLDRMPDAMGVRRQTVEHPFGTIKAWMGSTHFLTRTLKRVSTEMSLHVLAYNIKRVI